MAAPLRWPAAPMAEASETHLDQCSTWSSTGRMKCPARSNGGAAPMANRRVSLGGTTRRVSLGRPLGRAAMTHRGPGERDRRRMLARLLEILST